MLFLLDKMSLLLMSRSIRLNIDKYALKLDQSRIRTPYTLALTNALNYIAFPQRIVLIQH